MRGRQTRNEETMSMKLVMSGIVIASVIGLTDGSARAQTSDMQSGDSGSAGRACQAAESHPAMRVFAGSVSTTVENKAMVVRAAQFQARETILIVGVAGAAGLARRRSGYFGPRTKTRM